LALTAFQLLPVNYAGLALVFLGGALLVAEAFVPSFGILGVSGLASVALGSFMLFDVAGERLIVDRAIILTVMAVASALILAVGYLVVKTQHGRPTMGKEVLVGEIGRVVARIAPVGRVRVHGELWTAESDETIDVGEEVVIRQVEDLRLRVRHV
jgi:membrane-bound serine protease (ClpP class)